MGFVDRVVNDPIDAITDNQFTSSPSGILDGVRLVASYGTDAGAWADVAGKATGNPTLGTVGNIASTAYGLGGDTPGLDDGGAFDQGGSVGAGLDTAGDAASNLASTVSGVGDNTGAFDNTGSVGAGLDTAGDIPDTGAFDNTGSVGAGLDTAGDTPTTGGYTPSLGSGNSMVGNSLSDGGAFDQGGSFGGTSSSGDYNNYLNNVFNDTSSTGAFDQTGSQGAGLGFGGSNNSYGFSNLLSNLSSGAKVLGGANNTLKQYTGMSGGQLAKGLYDAYAKHQMSKSAGTQADTISNLFSPNSPYAQQLANQLAVRDSAAGRNSQYGPRSTELAADLAKNQLAALNSPGYQNLRASQTNNQLGMFNSLVSTATANAMASKIAQNTPSVIGSLMNGASAAGNAIMSLF